MIKISKDEKKVLVYLYRTCILGGGQYIYNIEEFGLDDVYETKRVSQIMQSLKRKGLVNNNQRIWYLTQDGKLIIRGLKS